MRRGSRHTAETRAKIAAARKGDKHPHKGASPTPETRAKISAKISAALLGKPKSPEHRAKLSAALRGRPLTPERRAKISAGVSAAYRSRKAAE